MRHDSKLGTKSTGYLRVNGAYMPLSPPMFTANAQVKLGQSSSWLAYTVQTGGSEVCTGYVNYEDSEHRLLAGELSSVVSIEWLQDHSSLLYTVPDAHGRPHKVGPVLRPW